MSSTQKIIAVAAALAHPIYNPIARIDAASEGLTPELRRVLEEHTPKGGSVEMGVIDWNMGADQLWGDDYAGDDYAGDDYAGDEYAGDYAGDDYAGGDGFGIRLGGRITQSVWRYDCKHLHLPAGTLRKGSH